MSEGGSTSRRFTLAIADLAPGYFALVMATGIVSIGMKGIGQSTISVVLLWICLVAFPTLIVLNLGRIIRARPRFSADTSNPARAFGFFTFVAATNVLGSRLAMDGRFQLAAALLVLASVTWFVLGYMIPWTAVLGRTTRPMLQTANGTWFNWVVASQSVAVLAATLEPQLPRWQVALGQVAVMAWVIGVFLYVAVAVFVSARIMLYEFGPRDLTPPFWVAMGATAITVVAGARIVEMADTPMLQATRGVITGTSVLFWIFGSWLIPPLIAAGYWRHVRHRVPLRYASDYWSVIFPLGMYGVGSQFLGHAVQISWLHSIGHIQAWIALVAWGITFVAMLTHIRTKLWSSTPIEA